MAEETQANVFITNLAGTEDLLLGYDADEQQIRDGEIVVTTRINAHNLPYRKPDGTITTVGLALDELYNGGQP